MFMFNKSVVKGPGFVHALPSLLNAATNSWPLVLLSSCAYVKYTQSDDNS
jgi:thiamine pyrophosphate-dependent acetolactate synthase large subunit-like protein